MNTAVKADFEVQKPQRSTFKPVNSHAQTKEKLLFLGLSERWVHLLSQISQIYLRIKLGRK